MQEKGRISMSHDLLERVEKFRSGFDLGSRVNVTTMSRSTSWRPILSEHLTMEVLDRNDTIAVMIDPETYMAVKRYVEALEEELEQVQLQAMFAARADLNDLQSGEDLERKAMESLLSMQDGIDDLFDGEQD
ncbi:MAG TPA: hypothetical protein VFV52_17825 [Bacilli bacterium]|nr:hypothetical protein [Bacilli bacterium]